MLTERDLTLRGFPASEVRAAIERGELKGAAIGTTFTTFESEFEEWLQTRAQAGRPVARQAGPGPRQTAPHAAGDAWSEWSGLVEQLVRNGTPQSVAIAGVDSLHPGLRERAVAAFNAAEKLRQQADANRIAAARDRLQRA